MERIGIAASKIAKGDLVVYNVYVVAITFLVSLLLFLLSGGAIFVGLLIIRLAFGPFLPTMDQRAWDMIFGVSLVSLTVLVLVVSLFAVSKNVKFKK